MRERPILLNADMVRAVLSGSKTQTRRIMKVQPSADFSPMNMELESDFTARWYTPGVVDKHGYLQPAKKQVFGVASEDEGYTCPFGAVGDRLWVRETFNGFWLDDDVIQEIKDGISKASELCSYRADFPDSSVAFEGWTPSIHMPRWASRITLEITGVRVERLNEMKRADCFAEGYPAERAEEGGFYDPTIWFSSLWTSIYGADSWNSNPWVWVIEFKRVGSE